jgi:MoxR-like ATPase
MGDETAADTLADSTAGGGRSLVPVAPHLFVVLEADRPTSGGARYALDGIDEVTIGRASRRSARREDASGSRRLAVRVPGRWMSSRHARLFREGDHWVLEDAGSMNGTFLEGRRIQRERLEDGAVFDAGHTVFSLRLAVPTPPDGAADGDSESLDDRPACMRSLRPDAVARLAAFERVARTTTIPLLILGETGTGKELLAKEAHRASGRSGRFVAVNCGGLAPTLVEGLLFGHIRGAFSGATRDEAGLVRAAHGGTLFLDEVAELPPAAQATLLRVLQEREVLAVGSTVPVPVDVRVVCATHQPLDAMVAAGRFRRDLLARIDGVRHAVPSLRNRREDLGLVVAELLQRRGTQVTPAVTLDLDAARALVAHPWPGNVRELESALSRALALAGDGRITEDGLSLALPAAEAEAPVGPLDEEEAELRDRLVAELRSHGGNVSEVARSMGKARMQVQRWMRRFGVDPHAYRKRS